jgi:LacI family transcriptional regulator
MATLGDVAAKAGVSVSAVSRVLSDHPSARVSSETRARIKLAARELDYRPNFAGRALKSARTNVIGLVMPDLTNALFTDLIDGAEDEVRAQGYMLLLGRSDEQRAGGDVIGRLIGEGRVDGVMVQLGDAIRPTALNNLFAAGSPVTMINARQDGHVGSVVLDDEAGARLATDHLLELGHERIGAITGLPATFTSQRRLKGFRTSMRAAGLRADPAHITKLGYLPHQGRAALRRIMTGGRPPTAVMVANVNAAIGVLAEARALGIRVPEDLSIVSVHDSWTAENTWPPLTTVKMPFHEMGRTAVRAIIHRLQKGSGVDAVVTDPAPLLVVRESAVRLR